MSPHDRAHGAAPSVPDPLPLPVVDNHCHLEIEDGEGLALEDHLARAAEVGVAESGFSCIFSLPTSAEATRWMPTSSTGASRR